MDQHPIPQNIASFQFKLFGNLTVRQFITLAIPMSLAAAIYFSGISPYIRLTLSGIIAIIAFIAALVPIQGRPLDRWLLAFFKAVIAPTQRIWIKEPQLPEFLEVVIAPPLPKQPPEPVTAQSRQKLLEYLRSLPKKYFTPLDIKEQVALARLNLGPEAAPQAGKLPPPIIWPAVQYPKAPLETAQAKSLPPTRKAPPPGAQIPGPAPRIAPHAKPFVLPGLEKKLKQKAQEPIELITYLDHKAPIETGFRAPRLASEINFSQEFVIPIKTPNQRLRLLPSVGKTRVRKLHFGPPVGFDLSKLPIRGERRFEISEELKRRFHFEDNPFEDNPQTVQAAPPVILPVEGLPEPATRTRLVPKQAHHVPKPTVNIQPAEDVSLKREAQEIIDSHISIQGKKLPESISSALLRQASIIPLTNKPNVISGQVTTKDGTPLEGTILIVRDQNGIPIRALKTNKLGQFLSATPLENGQYQVEVESEVAKFDHFTLNLEGKVLAPLEIKGV